MVDFRDQLIHRAEVLIDRTIEYSSLGPSLFGTFDLRGVRIVGSDLKPLVSVSRIRIGYSLFKLLRGDYAGALKSVRLDKPVISLDTLRDRDIISLFSTPAAAQPGAPGPVAGNPLMHLNKGVVLRVREGSFVWTDPNFDLRTGNISLNFLMEEDSFSLNGKWSIFFDSPTLLGQLGPLRFSAAAKGVVPKKFDGGSGTISLSSLSSERFILGETTAYVSYSHGRVEFRKIKDKLPFDLGVVYDTADASWHGEVKAERFMPSALVVLRGDWESQEPWLDTIVSGAADFSFTGGSGFSYSVDVEGDLSPDVPLGAASFAVEGNGTGERISFDSLEYRSSMGDFVYQGGVDFAPLGANGRLRVRNINIAENMGAEADLQLATEAGDIILFGDSLRIGPILFSAVDARLTLSETSGTFALSALRFLDIESYEDVRISRISIDGSLGFDPRLLQAEISVDSFSGKDTVDLIQLFAGISDLPPAISAVLNDSFFSTNVFVDTDFKNLSFNAPRLVAAYQNNIDMVAVLSVSGTGSRVDISQGSLVWSNGTVPGGSLITSASAEAAEGRVEGSAALDFSDPSDITFSLAATYLDLDYAIQGAILDQRFLSIQGNYGIQANLTFVDFGGFSGFFQADAIPIPWGSQVVRLSIANSLRWTSPQSWLIDIERCSLQNIVVLPSGSTGAVNLRGSVQQEGAVLEQLSYEDSAGLLSGRASFAWADSFSAISGNFRLANQDGLERYEGDGSFRDGAWEGRLYLSRATISRFYPNPYKATASGECRVIWKSPLDYSIDWLVSPLAGNVGDSDLALTASGSVRPNGVELENSRLSYGGLLIEVPQFSVDRLSSTASGTSRVRGTALSRDVDVNISADLTFAPIPDWSDFSKLLASLSGTIVVRDARIDAWSIPEAFSFELAQKDESIAILGGPQNAIRFQASSDGSFYAAFSNPAPVRGSVVGTFSNGIIDAGATNLYIDFPALWSLLPLGAIVDFTAGFVVADLRIKGPLGDPEFFGTAQGTSVRLTVPSWVNGEIGPLSVALSFEGNEMSFGPIKAAAGSGEALCSGLFRFDRWIPTVFDLDIEIPSPKPVPFRFDLFGVNAYGLASGELSLAMDEDGFHVGGALTAQNTIVTLKPQGAETPAQSTGDEIPLLVDLRVRTGRKVEFAWPSTDFPIIRGYADQGNGVRIVSDSSEGRFALTGDVSLRGGEVFYFQRSFYVRQGTMRFNENQIRFDPRISLRAEIRDRIDSGPITLALVVDDAPLSTFTPRLESDPPLSQIEIFAILGQNLSGFATGDKSDRFQEAFINASSDVLAQFNIIRVFERTVRDILNLDMFSVRTQVIQNAVLQATGLRSEPVDRIGTLGNYFDNTTVFFGKYIGSDMFLQSMLSLRYDENRAYDLFGGLTLEPDIGIELRTPLFALRWSFVPTHPEHLFIDDHSFSLNWKWSF